MPDLPILSIASKSTNKPHSIPRYLKGITDNLRLFQ